MKKESGTSGIKAGGGRDTDGLNNLMVLIRLQDIQELEQHERIK